MFGRAVEAVCTDLQLREKNVIDDRLFSWSEDLRAFRNVAAHVTEEAISRPDADDLQAFVYAMVEYIYDLTERYEEFRERQAANKKKKKQKDSP